MMEHIDEVYHSAVEVVVLYIYLVRPNVLQFIIAPSNALASIYLEETHGIVKRLQHGALKLLNYPI